jgi:acetolactate synthase-1/2/3 large subunit
MNKVKVADYVADYIASLGVKYVFLIPGGGNVSMVDSISKHESLKHVCNHHEQACAMAAEAYGRVGGNIGVCVTTVGPAATNAVTGIMGAWTDSIATLYLCGQVKREVMMSDGLRQMGVQEINIVDIARPITKYCEIVNEPNDIKYHLDKALYLARSGRPGPVLLDIPSDVQSTEVDLDAIRAFDPEAEGLVNKVPEALSAQVAEVAALLKAAKKPVIFAGHGIRLAGAHQEFLELVMKLNVPILTSMSAHDLIPTDHPLFVGRPGVFGDRAGNFAIQNADLLISIGARHHLWNIGYNYKEFARNAKKVVVDIDKNELQKKTVIPDISINTDAKVFITKLLAVAEKKEDIKEWIDRTSSWKQRYPVVLPVYK